MPLFTTARYPAAYDSLALANYSCFGNEGVDDLYFLRIGASVAELEVSHARFQWEACRSESMRL